MFKHLSTLKEKKNKGTNLFRYLVPILRNHLKLARRLSTHSPSPEPSRSSFRQDDVKVYEEDQRKESVRRSSVTSMDRYSFLGSEYARV